MKTMQVGLIACLAILSAASAAAQDVTAVTGGTVIAADGTTVADAVVLIEGARITRVGPEATTSIARSAAALRAATIDAGRMIGRDKEIGSVEPGKMADLLVLDANPLDDIRNIRRIHRVIKGGVVHDPADLLRNVRFVARPQLNP